VNAHIWGAMFNGSQYWGGGLIDTVMTENTWSGIPCGSITDPLTLSHQCDGGLSVTDWIAYYANPVPITGAVRASSNLVWRGTSVSASLANNSGDALIVACREGADQTSISSVTDTAGNNYTLVNKSSSTGNGGSEDALFVAFNVPASTGNTVSCNFASNLNHVEGIIVEEFSGLTGAIDGSVVSSNSSGAATSLTSGNLTTTNASDLLVYEVNQRDNVTFTAGPSYTISPGTATGRQALEYQVVNSTGTYSASMSWSAGASADGVFAAFKGN
jgi:hypothetical protein